jgi:hypothetical protein
MIGITYFGEDGEKSYAFKSKSKRLLCLQKRLPRRPRIPPVPMDNMAADPQPPPSKSLESNPPSNLPCDSWETPLPMGGSDIEEPEKEWM